MREILFRGKRVDNDEWVEGWLFKYMSSLCIGWEHGIECDYDDGGLKEHTYAFVIPETVGQYTGRCDKNGKKIFEGDVLEFSDEVWESFYTACGTEYNSWETKNRGVVGYCEDYGRFDFVKYLCNESSVDADLHENGDLQFADFIRDLEVIGNIHDNPELLEVDNGT